MRVIEIPKIGDPSVLRVAERPDPIPAPGEVRIDTAYAGLNFAEVMARKGLYPDAPPPPSVLGYEASGIVDAVGDGVEEFKPGDRVMVLSRFGAHASKVCAPEAHFFKLPTSMSFEEAAALPVNYITAYHILFRVHRLLPGDTILIHMAAGGVGTAAIQLARTVPDVTILGTASAGKHDFIRELGCHHPIDYRREDYVERTRELTGGMGPDLIVDALGGTDWKRGYQLLRAGGLLVAFGWANMSQGKTRSPIKTAREFFRQPLLFAPKMMQENRGVAGVNMGHLWHEMARLRLEAKELLRLYEEGAYQPIIDSIHSFEDAANAHARLEEGANVGKVLLRP